MSRIAPRILIFFIVATLVAPLAIGEPEEKRPPGELRYPGRSWALAVDLSGYEVAVGEVGRDPLRVRARGENFDSGVRLLIELAPAAGPETAAAARKHDWDETLQDGVARSGVRRSERGAMALVEYVIPEWKGVEVNQRNVHAYLAHDGVWMRIHLSKSGFEEADRAEFESVLGSLRIETP